MTCEQVDNGFEKLKLVMKNGNHQCDHIAAILKERAVLAQDYAKSLQKLSAKVDVSAKDMMGCAESSSAEPCARQVGCSSFVCLPVQDTQGRVVGLQSAA
jgi:CBS-domain-containing membrane protein